MKRHAALTSTYTNVLASNGTLTQQSLSKAHPAPLKRMARGVLAGIGIALCFMPDAGSTNAIQKEYISYKEYALYLLDFNYKEHQCLLKLYGKESAWNPDAIGNLQGTQRVYGIPQGKSEYLSTLNGYDQVQWGLDYIGHRYGEPCIAWQHFKDKGWH
jgi:hypothetical protein